MKKNGFTLAELMGVIVILSIIAVVVTLTVDRSIKNSRYTTCLTQEKNLIEGAKVWSIDNTTQLPTPSNPSLNTLTVLTLQTDGYIEDGLINPMTDAVYDPGVYIRIFVSSGTGATGKDFQYEVVYPDEKQKCHK